MIASVAYPIFSESGMSEIETSKICALILGVGGVPGSKRKKLEELLPPEADLWYHNGTLRVELDVPRDRRDKVSMHKLAKKIRGAIQKSLGVRAGFCPLTSSKEVVDLVRNDSRHGAS